MELMNKTKGSVLGPITAYLRDSSKPFVYSKYVEFHFQKWENFKKIVEYELLTANVHSASSTFQQENKSKDKIPSIKLHTQ